MSLISALEKLYNRSMSLFAWTKNLFERSWNWVFGGGTGWSPTGADDQPETIQPSQPLVHNFLFVDCAMTLFDRDNILSAERVAEVQALSKQLGLSIIAWTGAEPFRLSCYEKQLNATGLDWPLRSKHSYYGQTVAAAMDDDDPEMFEAGGIKCLDYYHVEHLT